MLALTPMFFSFGRTRMSGCLLAKSFRTSRLLSVEASSTTMISHGSRGWFNNAPIERGRYCAWLKLGTTAEIQGSAMRGDRVSVGSQSYGVNMPGGQHERKLALQS